MKGPRRRTVAALVALAAGSVGARPLAAAPAAGSVGFVLDVRGDWVVEGGMGGKLRVGQALAAGATIRAAPPQPQWRLVIALANGTTLARSCDPVERCREALVLPDSTAEQPGFWGRAKAAAAALFGHPPERFAATLARGAAASDGVALLEAGTLHLDSILGDLPAGRYAVSLKSIEPAGAAAVVRDMPLALSEAAVGARIEVPGLAPGLYEMTVRAETNPDEATSAWVLALGSARHRQGREAYDAARATAARWDGSPAASHPVVPASLPRGVGGGAVALRRAGGFVRHLLHAAPVIAVVSALVFVLGHWGFLRTFETAALDTWLRLKAPQPVANVVIVAITDCDYRELFGETSPLNPGRVADLLQAITVGRPKVVGVDLDTSHPSFAALCVPATEVPIVWARDAVAAEDDTHGCARVEPTSATTTPPAGDGGERHAASLRPAGALGRDTVAADVVAGISLMPQDPDGLIRRYRRTFDTTEGRLDSLAWAVVRRATARPAGVEPDELILNFAGNRYAFPRYSAADVLAGAKGEAWGEAGPLTGKIVLLGGLYRAARDEYLTPVGPRAGVELVAQAVESDLSGGGIRTTNEALMVALEILGGVVMVFLYSRCRLGTALALSLIGIPFLALFFSFTSFSSVGRWASFVPTMVAVLLHQLHHHAVEYRRLYLQAAEVSRSRWRGSTGRQSAGRGEGPPSRRPRRPA